MRLFCPVWLLLFWLHYFGLVCHWILNFQLSKYFLHFVFMLQDYPWIPSSSSSKHYFPFRICHVHSFIHFCQKIKKKNRKIREKETNLHFTVFCCCCRRCCCRWRKRMRKKSIHFNIIHFYSFWTGEKREWKFVPFDMGHWYIRSIVLSLLLWRSFLENLTCLIGILFSVVFLFFCFFLLLVVSRDDSIILHFFHVVNFKNGSYEFCKIFVFHFSHSFFLLTRHFQAYDFMDK